MTAAGAGMLCAACSALNQVQERAYDARMERTKDRPVATGIMPVWVAIDIAVMLFVLAFGVFLLAGGWQLLLLGLSIPLLYNGLYTPLKPVTPMALLIGGISGAMPPLTGWVGAGGAVTDAPIVAVTVIFYLWQVPHFWLLHEKHRDDYERAGFATLASQLPRVMYTPLLCIWVIAYFIGLGCLVLLNGSDAVWWLIPPASVLLGVGALFSILRNDIRRAGAAVYLSLPLALCALLVTSF
jgi:protoheme IX farnesyltransferase